MEIKKFPHRIHRYMDNIPPSMDMNMKPYTGFHIIMCRCEQHCLFCFTFLPSLHIHLKPLTSIIILFIFRFALIIALLLFRCSSTFANSRAKTFFFQLCVFFAIHKFTLANMKVFFSLSRIWRRLVCEFDLLAHEQTHIRTSGVSFWHITKANVNRTQSATTFCNTHTGA